MLSKKKENKSPAFQFYARDFLADINVQLMTMEERGIYITLLAYAWIEKGIPSDKSKLKRLCGNPDDFDSTIQNVLNCFQEHDGRYYNPRMESVRSEQLDRKQKMSDAGKKGAEKRWNNGVAIQKPLAKHNPATATATATAKIPYTDIQDLYNKKLGKVLPSINTLTNKRKSLIRSIWKDNPNIEFFDTLYGKVFKIPFLTGDNDRGWKADFDFVHKMDKVVKIMEGGYVGIGAKKEDNVFKRPEEIVYVCPKHPKHEERKGDRNLFAFCGIKDCRERMVNKDAENFEKLVQEALAG
tara:strand:- start:236 stop:1126 length:891 start_codon:yes stop_codon:yes gene_type:complete